MKVYVGTSGYSYKEWEGSFYPDKLPAAKRLAHYAERLPAVEINNTFYRLPKTQMLQTWAEQVPRDFRFVIKASRRITHVKRLKDAAEETAYLIDRVRCLEARLGAILFQLPPYLRKDIPRLKAFIEILPGDLRIALEFRHQSWLDDEVFELLGAKDIALCITDTDDGPTSPITSTASWGYLRLRRADYKHTDLQNWVKRLEAQSWPTAYVFFKHEDEGTGPKLAASLLEIAGRS